MKAGDFVRLELGEPAAADSITLRCVPVFGNDTSLKRNPRQPGYKATDLKIEQTFSISKDADTSIEYVRFSFLDSINSTLSLSTHTFEERDTEAVVPLDMANTRLRSTNWAEEAADVPLGELSATDRKPLLLSALVSSGLLKMGSLLHLESGHPPVPGMVEFEILVDTRNMGM